MRREARSSRYPSGGRSTGHDTEHKVKYTRSPPPLMSYCFSSSLQDPLSCYFLLVFIRCFFVSLLFLSCFFFIQISLKLITLLFSSLYLKNKLEFCLFNLLIYIKSVSKKKLKVYRSVGVSVDSQVYQQTTRWIRRQPGVSIDSQVYRSTSVPGNNQLYLQTP